MILTYEINTYYKGELQDCLEKNTFLEARICFEIKIEENNSFELVKVKNHKEKEVIRKG